MKAEHLTLTTSDRTRLAVDVVQDDAADDTTPTLVLAHGWTLTHDSWLPVVEALDGEDLRIVMWDQRGHGQSTLGMRLWQLRAAGVSHLGRDLHEIIEQVVPASSPVVLAGHSMGGMTLLSYAGQFAEEVRARVRGALLLSTASHGLTVGHVPAERLLMTVFAHGLPFAPGRLVTAQAQRDLLFGDDPDDVHVRATQAQVSATKLPTWGTFYGAMTRLDEKRSLEALRGVPTRIMVGAKDRLTPPVLSRQIAKGIPGAELTVLAGKGHMLTYEATDEVVAALRELIVA
jgi:pimeloyl-ACP methyl ester carboxylesterase